MTTGRFGPVVDRLRVRDGELVLRTPRLSDGVQWSQARLANRSWLERAFPAWGDDWAAEQTEVAWAQRWFGLRRAALRGRAVPFVLVLDGRLIGEIGIDAVDGISNSGEASVWMVREHGSNAVMYAASLLVVQHAFTGRRPLDRVISPVATSSRKGRSPGLTAVGLTIEGTVARPVGDAGFVDHDLWVIHNTPSTRAETAARIDALRAASRV